MEEIIYTDQRIPDIVGSFGKAWKQDLKSFARRHPELGVDGSICGWIVQAPWVHPLWPFYLIACVHLRPVPGTPDALILKAGATHEIFVVALDPGQQVPLNESPRMLHPLNFAGQWTADSDEQAAVKVEETVQAIVIHGTLSPDTDFIHLWVERFSNSNMNKWVGGGRYA